MPCNMFCSNKKNTGQKRIPLKYIFLRLSYKANQKVQYLKLKQALGPFLQSISNFKFKKQRS